MLDKNIMLTAIEIYDAQMKNTPHYYSSLIKTLDGRIDKNTVSQCLDVLSDYFLTDEKYEKINDGRVAKVIRISEDGIPLVKEWITKGT